MTNSLRVALIDSDPMVREGRALLLQSLPDINLVYQSSSADDALAAIGDYLLDVVIVDTRIAGWSPDKYIEKLASNLDESGNDARILATATFGSPQFELACLRAGAVGLATNENGMEQLVRLLKSALAQENVISREKLLRLLADAAAEIAPNPALALKLEGLDDNQKAVLALMLNGSTDGQISKELNFSKYRITKFLDSLRSANGYRTRIQLAIDLLGLGVF